MINKSGRGSRLMSWPTSVAIVAIAAAAVAIGGPFRTAPEAAIDFATVASTIQAETNEAAATPAGTEYFLKVEGIAGESTDSRHLGEIDLESVRWGFTNPATRTDVIPRRAAFADLTATARTSKASPPLMLACVQGKLLNQVVLSGRRPSATWDYLKVTLSDVRVSSFQPTAASNSVPLEQFSLHYNKIVIEYKVRTADGSAGALVRAGWDIKANKAI